MNAYASPTVGSPKRAISERTHYVEIGAATQMGAIVATVTWVLYGLVIMGFGLFGIDLFASIQQAQWVTGNAITEFSAITAPLVTYLIGIVASLIVGGIAGAVCAWLYDLVAGPGYEEA